MRCFRGSCKSASRRSSPWPPRWPSEPSRYSPCWPSDPALLLSNDGATLAHSVDSRLPSIGDPGHCGRGPNGNWHCHLLFEQDPGSGGGFVAYEVTADRFGCWRATRPKGSRSGDKLPAVMHGCAYLWDF